MKGMLYGLGAVVLLAVLVCAALVLYAVACNPPVRASAPAPWPESEASLVRDRDPNEGLLGYEMAPLAPIALRPLPPAAEDGEQKGIDEDDETPDETTWQLLRSAPFTDSGAAYALAETLEARGMPPDRVFVARRERPTGPVWVIELGPVSPPMAFELSQALAGAGVKFSAQ